MNKLIVILLISLSNLYIHTSCVSVNLNEHWKVTSANKNIVIFDANIPSGVYSELEKNKYTNSVLFSYNDVALRWVGHEAWTYSLDFNITQDILKHQSVVLTFDGVDTIADISLNGHELGKTRNMFTRYRYDVAEVLKEGTNHLKLQFTSPIAAANASSEEMKIKIPPTCPPSIYNGECHMNMLRKMQASFAWDWGLAAPSMGIWKPVYLEIYDSITIRDVNYQLTDKGDKWLVDVTVYVETGMRSSLVDGVLSYKLQTKEGVKGSQKFSFTSDSLGESALKFNFTVDKSQVQLWWPNGAGQQNLYNLVVKWEDRKVNSVIQHSDRRFCESSKTIKIGFRTIELVQEPMDNGLSFYFKINNVPIFMKGSNYIPSSIMPDLSLDKRKISSLLRATRDANMNMIRVWGGGVYESDYFYSKADEYGILIWQDMMFACAMYPATEDFLELVREEVKQQIRRLQPHPSIAIFAGNNENEAALRQDWYGTGGNFKKFAGDYIKLYEETIGDEIAKIDTTRSFLPSSPSNGAYIGAKVDGISIDPQDPHYGDIHFYVVGVNSWTIDKYHQPRFTSEYGFQSFPSGWSQSMDDRDNLTDLVYHRQHYPLKNQPIKYLINENLHLTVDYDYQTWGDRIYLSQVSQAMAMKAETEVYRTGRASFMNTMGALYWQLNDVWVAPSWSSIEFNGNFKMLHHWIKEIFAPLTVVPMMNTLNKTSIYVINDDINNDTEELRLVLNVRSWYHFDIVQTFDLKTQKYLKNTAILVTEFDTRKISLDNNSYFAQYLLVNSKNESVAENFVYPSLFKHLGLSNTIMKWKIADLVCQKSHMIINLELEVDAPAFFVQVEFRHATIVNYRVSRNGFNQLTPKTSVKVTLRNPKCSEQVIEDNFDVRILNQFI